MYSLFVVDDEDDIRRGIIESVDWEHLGFQIVGEAADGEDAMRKIEALSPDVVLSDIRMPGVDGVLLMRFIHEHFPRIKIIVLSGYSDFAYLESSIKNGVAAYLLKPTDLDAFRETFERLYGRLEEQRREDEERRWIDGLIKGCPGYIREKVSSRDQFQTANEKLAARILEYIDREYTSSALSLKTISEHVRKNSAYISKVFKAVTGDNYIHYVSKKRLAKAMELLQNSQLLVYQVTEAVGWSDQSSFIRLFKKEYGMTPSQVSRLKAPDVSGANP